MEEQLPGGVRNDVHTVRIGGRRYVARLTGRPQSALVWEIDLLLHLLRCEVRVPRPLEAADGRFEVDGLVIFEWMEGHEPGTERDWQRVAQTLRRVHAATTGWSQRPGFASCGELLEREGGGDVDLRAMPPEVVTRCRSAWETVQGMPVSVVHGDLNAHNIRIGADGVGLMDWDEARVDVWALDFADIPADLHERTRSTRMAAHAWEVATTWVKEPDYARGRLVRMRSQMEKIRERAGSRNLPMKS